jgi:hypothetical protein
MTGMHMSNEAVFAVPLPATLRPLAAPLAATAGSVNLVISVRPINGDEAAPVLKSVSIGAL